MLRALALHYRWPALSPKELDALLGVPCSCRNPIGSESDRNPLSTEASPPMKHKHPKPEPEPEPRPAKSKPHTTEHARKAAPPEHVPAPPKPRPMPAPAQPAQPAQPPPKPPAAAPVAAIPPTTASSVSVMQQLTVQMFAALIVQILGMLRGQVDPVSHPGSLQLIDVAIRIASCFAVPDTGAGPHMGLSLLTAAGHGNSVGLGNSVSISALPYNRTPLGLIQWAETKPIVKRG